MDLKDVLLNRRPEPTEYDPNEDDLAKVTSAEAKSLSAHTKRCGEREVRAQLSRIKHGNMLQDLKFDSTQTRMLLLALFVMLLFNNTIQVADILKFFGWFK